MKLKYLIFSFTLVWVTAKAQIPAGYYDPAAGKTGSQLKTALYTIISGHTALSYDNLWTAFATTDDKPDGKVWDMYSNCTFTFGTNQCGEYQNECDCYNREHSWPKSWFNDANPMYTDMFHLVPTDGKVNGMRSNYPYGEVSSPTYTSGNGSKLGPCSYTGYSGVVFEPIDEYKGDFARNYFYMATRYENIIAGWHVNDVNAEAILLDNNFPVFETWFLNMLGEWHVADPVSQKELDRNNTIYTSYQHNRNPFIDHPEYVYSVWGVGGSPVVLPEPSNHVTVLASTSVIPTNSAIDVTWTDATGGTIPEGYIVKAAVTDYTNILAPVDGIGETSGTLVKIVAQGNQVAHFTNLNGSTSYFFKIFPYTNTGANINYKTDSPPQTSATTTANTGSAKIFISEYIEGNNSNKAIELYNGENLALDMTKLVINLYTNGGLTITNTYTGSGSLLPNSSFVIYNSLANAEIIASGNISNAVVNFNGDDVVEVLYNGQVTDVFGTKGFDPGTSWNVAGNVSGAVDKTLLRKLSITQGNTNPSGSFGSDAATSEWVIMSTDYAKNLGSFGTAWKGTTSADWATSANWDLGTPAGINNAIIPDVATDPVVSTYAAVNNLLIKQSGVLTIGSNGALEATGTFTNNATTAGLIVNSGASLIENTPGINATVQRAVTGWTDAFHGWHLLSSPVAAQAIVPYFTDAIASNYDFYKWSEPTNTWLNQKTVANNITSFSPGTGYLVAYASSATKQFAGTLNASDVQVSGLTKSSGSNSGWNLLGNPFASAISLNKGNWAFTNVTATAKIWQESSGSYVDIASDDGIIPAMNGFMVETSGSGSLTIPAAAREHSSNAWYKSSKNRIKLVANDLVNNLSQECNILINSKATEGFDTEYDSHFLGGFAPAFYSIASSEHLSSNTLPDIGNKQIVQLGFVKNTSDIFSIELVENNFSENKTIYLTDNKTGTITNLGKEAVYNFTASSIDDDNRFALGFETSSGINQITTSTIQAYIVGKTLYINQTEQLPGRILLYNPTGQLLKEKTLEASSSQTVNLSGVVPGIYLVSVITCKGIFYQKVFVNP